MRVTRPWDSAPELLAFAPALPLPPRLPEQRPRPPLSPLLSRPPSGPALNIPRAPPAIALYGSFKAAAATRAAAAGDGGQGSEGRPGGPYPPCPGPAPPPPAPRERTRPGSASAAEHPAGAPHHARNSFHRRGRGTQHTRRLYLYRQHPSDTLLQTPPTAPGHRQAGRKTTQACELGRRAGEGWWRKESKGRRRKGEQFLSSLSLLAAPPARASSEVLGRGGDIN